ncbi:MAG: siderophore-interacting protein [Pseudoclavibacter sp.]
MQGSSVRSQTRPGYRPFVTKVAAVTELSPHFIRITLRGDELVHFGTDGHDQRIKLVIPFGDGSTTDVGYTDEDVIADASWYARWRELPDTERNPIRTYTVRAVRPGACEIDIDIVRHDALPGTELGPAATWAAATSVGRELVVVGPDSRSDQSHTGIDWHPGSARRLLIVGDETAVPAALAILERLPDHVEVDAILEVPSRADILPVRTRADAMVTWLDRESAASGATTGGAGARASASAPTGSKVAATPGELLVPALQRWTAANPEAYATAIGTRVQLDDVDVDVERIWDSPETPAHTPFYAWLAGEQAAIKRMRRHLVSETGIDRGSVAFMGYWRYGVADIA